MITLRSRVPAGPLAGAPVPPGPAEWSDYLAHHGRSFWFAARLIPEVHRHTLAGVYAFCRYTDNLVDDGVGTPREIEQRLDDWVALARQAYSGKYTGVALLDIVMSQAARGGVPFVYVEELVEGMRMDLTPREYATMDELRVYCYRAASVVGLWLTRLFGVHDAATLQRASLLGQGMQLTNILRDVGEDLDRGRLYLPLDRMAAHGVTRGMLEEMRRGRGPVPASYMALVEELIDVAEADYGASDAGIPSLPAFFRPSVAVASRVYAGIHEAIRAAGHDTVRRRASTTAAQKMLLARRALRDLGMEDDQPVLAAVASVAAAVA
jgi:15-cis-phytoene synthase